MYIVLDFSINCFTTISLGIYCWSKFWKPISICWGRVTYICVGNLTIIGLDNCVSPYRHQVIIWTNAGMLIRALETNLGESSIDIVILSFKKMRLKVSSAKWLLFCLGLNVLIPYCGNPYLPGLGETCSKGTVKSLSSCIRFLGVCSACIQAVKINVWLEHSTIIQFSLIWRQYTRHRSKIWINVCLDCSTILQLSVIRGPSQ